MRRKTNHKEIFDTLPESIIIVDKDFTVLEMNDYAEGTFRISREKAYGRHSRTFMPKELEEVALMAMEESRTIFGDEINPSLRGRRKDRDTARGNAAIRPHRRAQGRYNPD
ncbi:MAG: PAS domain S-box protein [Thermodesulfobacteriota bacterium]